MPSYDYQCPKCSKIEEHVHRMSEEPEYLCCDDVVMKKVILSAPMTNMGWDMQAAGNASKYWGSKPIRDIKFDNADGSTTIIAGENSDFQ